MCPIVKVFRSEVLSSKENKYIPSYNSPLPVIPSADEDRTKLTNDRARLKGNQSGEGEIGLF